MTWSNYKEVLAAETPAVPRPLKLLACGAVEREVKWWTAGTLMSMTVNDRRRERDGAA